MSPRILPLRGCIGATALRTTWAERRSELSERDDLRCQCALEVVLQRLVPVDDDVLVRALDEAGGERDFQSALVAAVAEERVATVGVFPERVLQYPEPDAARRAQCVAILRLHARNRLAIAARPAGKIHVAERPHVRIADQMHALVRRAIQRHEVA